MSLDAAQIATKGDLEALYSRIAALVNTSAPAVVSGDEYLTLDEVAEATRTSVRTVRKWIVEGKYDLKGKRIKLFALEFSDGFNRIPRAALVAYGLKMGFSVSDLANPPQMRLAS